MDARRWALAAILGSALASAPAEAQSSDDDVRIIDGRRCRRDDSRPVLRSGPRWVCEDAKPEPERERVRRRETRR